MKINYKLCRGTEFWSCRSSLLKPNNSSEYYWVGASKHMCWLSVEILERRQDGVVSRLTVVDITRDTTLHTRSE